ncbi:hypothetical protein CWI38_0088p0040 [Hamiltosporidium tvaerminnensis]|uniref:Uncharacterized protein n=1 Tax=Hamiltosporidium tvaerminnensis TaxID=1176355 RepID=A0A4Q9M113_9MICR|nr:hypothetical protein CWI38_0088p0040 [Hamiltosporidium tvaerminnensis]
MLSKRKLAALRKKDQPFFLISRLKQPKWHKLWYRRAKNFIYKYLFFVFFVIIDLIIVYSLEKIFNGNIRIRILFFVALIHVYQRAYFSIINFSFYSQLIPKNRYEVILRIGILLTYLMQTIGDDSTRNNIFVNFKIHNTFIAAILGSLSSFLSYILFHFTMNLFPVFLKEYQNFPRILIAMWIALFFFVLVSCYDLNCFLVYILAELEFLLLLPSYIVVGLTIAINPYFRHLRRNYLHDILRSIVYICIQWPFIANIFKSIYSRFIIPQMNLNACKNSSLNLNLME